MVFNLFKKIFLSKNDRILEKYKKILYEVNLLEKGISSLSDTDLKFKFLDLKPNIKNFNDLDKCLPLVFAIVREVSNRVMNMRHFDVQILGGIALYQKKIVEIATGEGKTLVATLPICLYSLLNKSIHVITVNDYLAKRDSEWMLPIYNFLNISCGTILPDMSVIKKQNIYKNNVVYGTSSEFGFDYLRDNIILSASDKVQSSLFYAIIDEVDSILIDEARTPLIISEPEKKDYAIINLINKLINKLILCEKDSNDAHYFLDEKIKNVYLTEKGFLYLEKLLQNNGLLKINESLYNFYNLELLHYVYAALKAKHFYFKDIDYIIKDNSILIIDERTGRIMDGRRWGDGIHQAVEAKEFLPIRGENPTLASITFQNYFRLYENLCGMTGTASTESLEFEDIYNLDVVIIPTNKQCIRIDYSDIIFLNKKYKFEAILKDILSCYNIGRPVLVGTVSISVSEFLSKMLTNIGIKHHVLNAKYHELESDIISEAGKFKSVTIATNMAGRGTDIVLGGKNSYNTKNLEYSNIIKIGGLKIIGTERHESRRIDNQLRGRSGRQGDPGSTQFYLSLEDDLIRIFIGDKSKNLLTKFNIGEKDAITHPLITKSIENAQKKVELYNFNIRKDLLDFDNILNEQRNVIYKYRNYLIFSSNISNFIFDILKDLSFSLVNKFYNVNNYVYSAEDLIKHLNLDFNFDFNISLDNIDKDFLVKFVFDSFYENYFFKKYKISDSFFEFSFEKYLLLNILDLKWKEYIIDLDYFKKGIYLRSYANKDPKDEYKRESFNMFNDMLNVFRSEFISFFFKFSFKIDNDFNYSVLNKKNLKLEHNEINFINNNLDKTDFINKENYKIGRNEICFCGSQKKFKYCHGKN